ncbi:hypothetical protein ACH49O_13300 [Streptomyces coeruleorubidus]|uniref:hypothetical protein n=1 Tax=Streptomyces coeruleorubidus TaxID=116188 RepID=UPI0033C5868D
MTSAEQRRDHVSQLSEALVVQAGEACRPGVGDQDHRHSPAECGGQFDDVGVDPAGEPAPRPDQVLGPGERSADGCQDLRDPVPPLLVAEPARDGCLKKLAVERRAGQGALGQWRASLSP